VTTTTTTGQTTTTTAEEVQFIDVGIQLVVTPTVINNDGFVTMKIKPEISSVVSTLTTPSKNQIPIVDTSTAETNVLVKDGSTVIIGGLRKDQKKFANDQIPFLGGIPVIGELFKQRDKDDELTELVVFITPHIVSGDLLVTGDEPALGARIKPYRSYEPVLSEPSPPMRAPQP
jgi:type II secretory pathway component GspD/PulD (secretin)